MPDSKEEKWWIAGLKAGNPAVFERIYEEYWSRLYVSAFNILRDRGQAEDVVQEVFSHLWKQRQSVAIQCLPAWLYTAVRYQVFHVIRSGKVHSKFREACFSEIAIENMAEAKLSYEEVHSRLLAAIEQLPLRCREIFVLSRLEYRSHQEIAEQLHITPKTVENQITIALKKLRVTLADILLMLPFLLLK